MEKIKKISLLVGIIATVVGIWISLGLPTFKKEDIVTKVIDTRPKIKVRYNYRTNETPVQSILYTTDSGTTEIRTPIGNSKLMEIE